jgi:protein-S-isoprenylcysteine O-methyltransferase Ste14
MDWFFFEVVLRWACGGITIVCMLVAVGRLLVNLSRANSQFPQQPVPRLRNPWYYLIGSLLFTALLVALWRPVRIELLGGWQIALDVFGAILLLLGMAGYQWGHITLGRSSTAAPLSLEHRLISQGPYRITRHPMYLALQIATLGSLLLYLNWAVLFCFLSFIFLFLRARREEEALSQRYGEEWKSYASQVPFWFPRFQWKKKS